MAMHILPEGATDPSWPIALAAAQFIIERSKGSGNTAVSAVLNSFRLIFKAANPNRSDADIAAQMAELTAAFAAAHRKHQQN